MISISLSLVIAYVSYVDYALSQTAPGTIGNGCLINMQEQIALVVHYHLSKTLFVSAFPPISPLLPLLKSVKKK